MEDSIFQWDIRFNKYFLPAIDSSEKFFVDKIIRMLNCQVNGDSRISLEDAICFADSIRGEKSLSSFALLEKEEQ
ncbi:MAG TPA: hypothetical protein DCQ37_13640 [Desulfobacteraceae bacterium]|nr:hypothetical protein [Desulfobacteraceae bacterium]